jgi:hypothetical protein
VAKACGRPKSAAAAAAAVAAVAPGDWWVEVLRFYSAKDLREVAKACGRPVTLPADFQLGHELLRGMAHEHWPMRDVQGGRTGGRYGASLLQVTST